jgi:predicted negative regulator of RcsB-dependent stress response
MRGRPTSGLAAGAPGEAPANDIFTDPSIAQAAVEDPLFRWLHRNWKVFLVTVLALIFGSYGWEQFKRTEQDRMAEYADLYERVGEQFESLVRQSRELADLTAGAVVMDDETKKKLTELETSRDQSLQRLRDSLAVLGDTSKPYSDLASLYRGLAEVVTGNSEEATRILASGVLAEGKTGRDWRAARAAGTPNLIAELAALARARVQVDSDATFLEGWAELKDLAAQGHYVFAGALLTLSRVARDANERAEAATLLSQVQAERPEQAELLEQAVARL